MNEQERSELERLKQRQARLEQELAVFATELNVLEQRLSRPPEAAGQDTSEARGQKPESGRHSPAELTTRPLCWTNHPSEAGGHGPVVMPTESPSQVQRPAPKTISITPPSIPPVIPPVPLVARTSVQPETVGPKAVPVAAVPRVRLRVEVGEKNLLKGHCQSCGGHLEFMAGTVGDAILCPHCGESTVLSTAGGPIPVPPPVAKAALAASGPSASSRPAWDRGMGKPGPAEQESFEMRLGTYWLVRIGIVIILTALVFFGNLAYQNIISKLGPGGKVSLLYLASAALLAAGGWWQRKAAKESLKNYAHVLFAGGLAAVYFTTYAAHYNEHLKVIPNQTLAGALLLVWAGFMAWIADRKKSEVLALFAVGLAYYTSIITRVGMFTLYSNLVLTATAVLFLVRNRWATLSFASLVATYAAYAFWRFFDGSAWHWASPAEGLWTGTYFLMSYWLVFTAAVFLSKDQKFARENRAAFLTLNNGAFFTGFLLTMLQVQHGGFWKFSLTYGSVLLVLAEVARRVLAAEPLAKNAYLTQGLLLVTVGIISNPHLAGLQLALVLATESVILLITGQQRKNLVLLAGAYITAGLAVGWGVDGMRQFDRQGLWLGVGLGGLMMVNTFLAHRQAEAASRVMLRPQPAYFTVLALLVWLIAVWGNTTRAHFPLMLAAVALPLTLSIYVLRVREVTLLSQMYMFLAQLAWVVNAFDASQSPPWWDPALIIAISLGLSHWWQKQEVIDVSSEIGRFWQGLYALAIIGLLYGWLGPRSDSPSWLAVASLLAVGITAYGVFTRAWLLAACGQIFMLVSSVQFVLQLWQGKPHWHWPLAPIAALALLSFGTIKWFERKPDASGRVSQPLLQIAMLYRWVALVMSICWVCEYIPERERIWLLALLGLWVFVWAGWRQNQEALFFGAAYTVVALTLFWLPLLEASRVYWPNLMVILILLGQRQFARRLPERYPLEPEVHAAVIIVGGLSLWRFLSLWVLEQQPGGFYLTASWSLLALGLFTAGIVLRERMYRWLGLGILACALGRVMIIDVWRLETIYRILSLMALGIVLLVLGFIYNKYQEKLREWL